MPITIVLQKVRACEETSYVWVSETRTVGGDSPTASAPGKGRQPWILTRWVLPPRQGVRRSTHHRFGRRSDFGVRSVEPLSSYARYTRPQGKTWGFVITKHKVFLRRFGSLGLRVCSDKGWPSFVGEASLALASTLGSRLGSARAGLLRDLVLHGKHAVPDAAAWADPRAVPPLLGGGVTGGSVRKVVLRRGGGRVQCATPRGTSGLTLHASPGGP